MSDEFETTVEVTRGTGTSDRDKFRTKVTAPDMETLTERVRELREEVEDWAEDFRTIQPDGDQRHLSDDQSTLGGDE
ncbi:DUF7389 domain-containing protein [Halobaculum lipolyticum]|uniref:DUF7389 domain-containing protein n=1 Tax=Halobaculum lipolyticum TaxID=3032001 RepID=A0ABD5WCR2_9EURY|nr:hypothetical protein [Halobaculum sp. DT31]